MVFALAFLAGGALLFSIRSETQPDRADAARPSFAHAFPVGRRLTYDLDYRSEALVDGTLERSTASRQEGAPRDESVLTLSSSITGKLVLTVVDHRADGSARVLASLAEVGILVTVGGRAVTLPDGTFAPLARGFFVEYGPSGDVRGIAVEEETHPVAARLASQVIAFLQLEAPRGHADAWETDEKDSLGELHARYSVLEDKPSRVGGQIIQKLVARRMAPRASGALARLIAAGGTAGTATLAYEVAPAEGILLEAAGALTTEQLLGDLRVGSDDSTLVVRLIGDEVSDATDLLRGNAERAAVLGGVRPLDPVQLRALERRQENETLLARIDLAAVVADARAHPPPPQSRDAATYARLLSAAVDVSADARARLEGIMLEPRIEERAFVPLARAFGEASSADAQAVLVRVIDGRAKNDPGRDVALFSLGRADAPTDATVAHLERLSSAKEDPYALAASFALGRVAGQLMATDPRRGAPVLERLLARVESAANDVERAQMLDAIGNAGAPSVEGSLGRWSKPDVPLPVRRAAVSAFRLVPTTTARDALLAALANDAEPSVRSAALESVLLRRPDDRIADAVADRLEHDADESVKKPAASRLLSLCRRSARACEHIERLKLSGDEWTRHELASFVRP